MTYNELILRLLLQLTIILLTCQIISYLGKRFLAQSNVVGEMIAGVLLGPTLLGALFPEFQNWLFPHEPLLLHNGQTIPNPSMMVLYGISQVALVLYMFLAGLDFNTTTLKKNFKGASIISFSGLALPFILGMAIVYFLPSSSSFFEANISTSSAAIFLGASLSITAFPMMVRILEENRITNTSFGTLALSSGALGDLAAWIMLAGLMSVIKENSAILFFAIIGLFLYLLLMLLAHKALTRFPILFKESGQNFSDRLLSVVLSILMFCAWFTDKIGIYAVFGAFLAGIAMPRGIFSQQIRERSLSLVTALLLPTFFVFSGLNTQISLLNTPTIWLLAGVIILAAIVGKGLGCTLAAKLTGQNWRESATIGVLMNARGLMELIIINIGLQEGIINHTLFTVLVLMAIITTLAATPLYHLIQKQPRSS